MTRMIRQVFVEAIHDNGTVINLPVNALIDTGSDGTFISKAFADKICDPIQIDENFLNEDKKQEVDTHTERLKLTMAVREKYHFLNLMKNIDRLFCVHPKNILYPMM